VVPDAVCPIDAGGQGQAEEGLPGEPPGEVCMAYSCGNKHPKVCIMADHSKGKIPNATCALWHMRVPFAGKTAPEKLHREVKRPKPFLRQQGEQQQQGKGPAGQAGHESCKARGNSPGLGAQGKDQDATTHPQAPIHVALRGQQHACPALIPEGSIAMLEDIIGWLRIPFPQKTQKAASNCRYGHQGGQEDDKKKKNFGNLCSGRELALLNLLRSLPAATATSTSRGTTPTSRTHPTC
jgi:hypothetical protein